MHSRTVPGPRFFSYLQVMQIKFSFHLNKVSGSLFSVFPSEVPVDISQLASVRGIVAVLKGKYQHTATRKN